MEFNTKQYCYQQYGLIAIIRDQYRPTKLDCLQLTGQLDPSWPKPKM